MPSKPLRLAVLLSGTGSNLQAIIHSIENGQLNAHIIAVGSDKANAGGLEIAHQHHIHTFHFAPANFNSRAEFDSHLSKHLRTFDIDLVVLAGYMRILSENFVDDFQGKLINIHPSLLPKFKGLDTHRRALEAGEQFHGCSVHFVTKELDGGPIIAQASCAIEPCDTEHSLKKKVQVLEHQLFPEVIQWIAQGKVKFQNGELLTDVEKAHVKQ